ACQQKRAISTGSNRCTYWRNSSKLKFPISSETLHEDSFYRRLLLRRDSLRMHGRADHDASLSLSRLPASQRRSVFVFRGRAGGSFQVLARLTTLPCLAQSDGWQDPSGLLP